MYTLLGFGVMSIAPLSRSGVDFFHRVFDDRVIFGGEVGDDDIIIFANGADKRYKKFTFNDSAVF